MKILLGALDLFAGITDEHIFYASLIRANPSVQFYYLAHYESQDNVRPANAVPLRLAQYLSIPSKFASGTIPEFAPDLAFVRLNAARLATDLARASSGLFFDVVDVPLSSEVQQYLKPALQQHNVSYGLVASLLNLPVSDELQSQASSADMHYTFSEKLCEQWSLHLNKQVHYIDPLHVIVIPQVQNKKSSNAPIINYFSSAGREKNHEYFLELIWFLDKRIYGSTKFHGLWSDHNTQQIRKLVANRGVPVEVCGISELSKVKAIYAERSLNVCASDLQFNLLALQSLISGCPTIIGDNSGVLNFLNKRFPLLPHLVLPTFNTRLVNQKVSDLLQRYDDHREQLKTALEITNFLTEGPDLIWVYKSGAKPTVPCGTTELVEYQKLIELPKVMPVYRRVWPKVKDRLKQLSRMPSHYFRRMVNKLTVLLVDRLAQSPCSLFASQLKAAIGLGVEISSAEFGQRDFLFKLIGRCQVDRVRIFRQLADIEMQAGRDLIWATYQIRVMRWLGYDKFGELSATKQVLLKDGFIQEAFLLDIIFGESSSKDLYDLLIDRLNINRSLPEFHYEVIDDRRTKGAYQCGVIVSLYNASDNLAYFLTDLCEQTLVRTGQCEIILIDSASPSNEQQVFLEFMRGRNVEIVFARNESRETIQGAWNRGVSLSRSKYLALLGVDEMIRPDTLEILSGELDKDPTLDWIGANSLLAPVDKSGQWHADILLYDRSGYDQDICLLDGSYLTYAGALYRKSIHDRFGFYDSSFKAGGDNEFRFRILPFIKSKTWPETLGMFRDFPGERVTGHPRAEIEDLRGWYLFRTPQGTAYSFQNRPLEDVLQQLKRCFAFRWAGSRHLSSNIDYALNIILYIESNYDYNVPILKKLVIQAQAELRALEVLRYHAPARIAAQFLCSLFRLKYIGWRISRICSGSKASTVFNIFNDNRYEQHYYPWN